MDVAAIPSSQAHVPITLGEIGLRPPEMKIFLDCEFTDLVGIKADPKLISVGLAGPDDMTFYAELVDSWIPADCSDFVREAVLPQLTGGAARMTETECAQHLKDWIEAINKPVELLSDSPSFDCPFIQDLFDRYAWPSNLSRECGWAAEGRPLDVWNQAVEGFWEAMRRKGYGRHHALHDAMASRAGWLVTSQRLDSE